MYKRIITIFLIITFIISIGATYWLTRYTNEAESELSGFDYQITSVDTAEFIQLSKNDNAFLLDVHIPEQSHIPGTDAFIPYNEISDNLQQLPSDKNTQILVYCRSGSMSQEAAVELKNLGYTNVINLAGGINGYKEQNEAIEISPVTRDLGTVIYGEISEAEFTLTNFSTQKLEITKVSTSCSCTSAEVEKDSLEPYESTLVKVSFNPAVHKDDTDLGDLTRTIYIDTDNQNFPQLSATITANVIKK
jgi:rhodanese-related sulfurtransferase